MKNKIILKEIFRYGVVFALFLVIYLEGYHGHTITDNFRKDCISCTTQACMDDDAICGDFGVYWVKDSEMVAICVLSAYVIIRLLNPEAQA